MNMLAPFALGFDSFIGCLAVAPLEGPGNTGRLFRFVRPGRLADWSIARAAWLSERTRQLITGFAMVAAGAVI
jgi:hypothetical protein